MSSKPITETSPGTFIPESRRARMAPMAEMSLKANIAVKWLCLASRDFVTSYPVLQDQRFRVEIYMPVDDVAKNYNDFVAAGRDLEVRKLVAEVKRFLKK